VKNHFLPLDYKVPLIVMVHLSTIIYSLFFLRSSSAISLALLYPFTISKCISFKPDFQSGYKLKRKERKRKKK
jgi:hypothetical protein